MRGNFAHTSSLANERSTRSRSTLASKPRLPRSCNHSSIGLWLCFGMFSAVSSGLAGVKPPARVGVRQPQDEQAAAAERSRHPSEQGNLGIGIQVMQDVDHHDDVCIGQ